MKPKKAAQELRRLASALEAAKNPSKAVVSAAVSDLLWRIGSEEVPLQEQEKWLKKAQEAAAAGDVELLKACLGNLKDVVLYAIDHAGNFITADD